MFVAASGLVTITGGKWTTYRRMGRDAVDRAEQVAGLSGRPSATESLRLHGGSNDLPGGPFAGYGSDAPDLERLVRDDPRLGDSIHPRLPDRQAGVIWAARFELARTVEDVLARRTRILFLDASAASEAAPTVARLLAGELGFGSDWERIQVESFRTLAAGYRPD